MLYSIDTSYMNVSRVEIFIRPLEVMKRYVSG